jgi:hypothetical protein
VVKINLVDAEDIGGGFITEAISAEQAIQSEILQLCRPRNSELPDWLMKYGKKKAASTKRNQRQQSIRAFFEEWKAASKGGL